MAKTTEKDLNMGNMNEKNPDFNRSPSRTGTGTPDTGTKGLKHEPDTSRRPTENYKGSTGNISEDVIGEEKDLGSDIERQGMNGAQYEQ